MKVIKPPRPITIAIEFTEEEATILCALVGGITLSFSPAGNVVRDLFDSLNDNLPDRTKSFSDFFEGKVEAKK
jgi:hypothetical protein